MIRLTQPLLPALEQFASFLEPVWEEAWLTNGGRQQAELERQLKGRLRAPNLSLFCNGTIGLLLGLRALGLKGEVITTPFTFPATTHAIDWAGLTPVFADIDPRTLCINPAKIEELITPATSAILAVHVFGVPCDVDALEAIARRHHLKLVFDAAHAFDVEAGGRPVADFGDMSLFSFHATKLFHTAEGGALTYRDPALKERLRLLHNFGIEDEDTVRMSGMNGKLNEVQAALGLAVLEALDEERHRRSRVVARYRQNLTGVPGVTLVEPGPGVRPSLQYVAVRIGAESSRNRDAIFEELKAQGILARRYFRPLCSQIDCYRHLPTAAPSHLPVATRVVDEILCLPFYGALSNAQVDQVCDIVASAALA